MTSKTNYQSIPIGRCSQIKKERDFMQLEWESFTKAYYSQAMEESNAIFLFRFVKAYIVEDIGGR